MDTIDHSSEAPQRAHRRGRTTALVALGVALGLAVAFGPRVFDDADAARERKPLPSGSVPLASLSTSQVAEAALTAGAAVASASSATEPPDAPASSAQAAIERFLSAEIAGRFDLSYGLLSAEDRTRARGRASWAANHANLPPVTGFAVDSVLESGDEVVVVARTDLRTSLDEVVGLVPAQAQGRWIAVREDGGWRVAYSRSRLEPQYPSEALAVDAAQEWLAARQVCRTAAEWSGGLFGSRTIARKLCGDVGPLEIGAPTRLPDDSSVNSLAAAFGPDVYAWARLVPVAEPARLDLIVAPVGERWLVIGAIEASASAS